MKPYRDGGLLQITKWKESKSGGGF